METTRERAEQMQKVASAMFALADAEDSKDEANIESAAKDVLFESMKLKIMGIQKVQRMEELKPCPFCGSSAEVICYYDLEPVRYRVACAVCGAERRMSFETNEKAVMNWNERI